MNLVKKRINWLSVKSISDVFYVGQSRQHLFRGTNALTVMGQLFGKVCGTNIFFLTGRRIFSY